MKTPKMQADDDLSVTIRYYCCISSKTLILTNTAKTTLKARAELKIKRQEHTADTRNLESRVFRPVPGIGRYPE